MKINAPSLKLDLHDIERLMNNTTETTGLVSLSKIYNQKSQWLDGRFELYRFKNIAYVGIKDFTIKNSFDTTATLENIISFEFMLSGGADMLIGEKHILNNDMPRLYLSSHKANSKQVRFHKSGEKYIGVGIWITPENLQHEFGLKLPQFSDLTAQILSVQQNSSLIYPITNNIRTIIESILTNDFEDEMENRYLEAKITELICHSLLCIRSPELAFNQDNNLSTLKSIAMKKLLAILNEDTEQVPNLATLSNTLAMSTAQLTTTFKASYGMNISEYLLQKKMLKAQELIKAGKFTVLQIAIEVGYKNQSSFGRAFKKFFGYSALKSKPR